LSDRSSDPLSHWGADEGNSSLAGGAESKYTVLGRVSSPLWLCGFWTSGSVPRPSATSVQAARLLPFCRSTGVAVMSAFFPRNCTPHVAPLGSHTAMLGDQPVLIPGDKLSLESVVGGSRFLSSTEAILHFFPCSPTVWTGRTPTVLAAGLRRSWTNVSNAFSTNVPIGAPPVACRGNGLVHP
jgi:hypothetical protein